MAKRFKYDLFSGQMVMVDSVTATAATKYYKCATVDTVNKTWTGYELLSSSFLSDVFAVSATSLEYSSIVPVVGRIYTEDAKTRILTEAPVFYASLASAASNAETGQVLTPSGTITYQSVDDIPCAYFNGSSKISFSPAALPSGGVDFTASFLIRYPALQSDTTALGWGRSGEYCRPVMGAKSTGAMWLDWFGRNLVSAGGVISANTWFHYLVTNSQTSGVKLYGNGVNVYTDANLKITPGNNVAGIGFNPLEQDGNITAYIAGVRIYDRVLESAEISALTDELPG